jgi:hypothetical protein
MRTNKVEAPGAFMAFYQMRNPTLRIVRETTCRFWFNQIHIVRFGI